MSIGGYITQYACIQSNTEEEHCQVVITLEGKDFCANIKLGVDVWSWKQVAQKERKNEGQRDRERERETEWEKKQ